MIFHTDGPELYDARIYSGYVEAYFSDTSWRRVGNAGGTWTDANSEVVCREQGYSTNGR